MQTLGTIDNSLPKAKNLLKVLQFHDFGRTSDFNVPPCFTRKRSHFQLFHFPFSGILVKILASIFTIKRSHFQLFHFSFPGIINYEHSRENIETFLFPTTEKLQISDSSIVFSCYARIAYLQIQLCQL